MSKDNKKMNPVHPGIILEEEFLKPMGLSQNKLALSIGVHDRRINQIVHGKRRITADTALRLAKFFGNSAEFWMNIQSRYDLESTKEDKFDEISKEVRPITSLSDKAKKEIDKSLAQLKKGEISTYESVDDIFNRLSDK